MTGFPRHDKRLTARAAAVPHNAEPAERQRRATRLKASLDLDDRDHGLAGQPRGYAASGRDAPTPRLDAARSRPPRSWWPIAHVGGSSR